MANQIKFRVLRITKELQSAMASKKGMQGETNSTVITNAVESQLPSLVAGLESLGFGTDTGKKKSARFPVTEETLATLRSASVKVKLPASVLLLLCLSNATGMKGKVTRKPRVTATPAPEFQAHGKRKDLKKVVQA